MMYQNNEEAKGKNSSVHLSVPLLVHAWDLVVNWMVMIKAVSFGILGFYSIFSFLLSSRFFGLFYLQDIL